MLLVGLSLESKKGSLQVLASKKSNTFLKCSVQQAEVIRVHTDLRVGHYYGDMGVDFWKAERWAEEIEKNQVSETSRVLVEPVPSGKVL